ncbi:MAG: hypothetical protein ACXACA_06530 [Candidatus Ranarchaeia archaeon]|jgi:hypothetical protein
MDENPVVLVCIDQDADLILPEIIPAAKRKIITISIHTNLPEMIRSPATYRLFVPKDPKGLKDFPVEIKELTTPFAVSFFVTKSVTPHMEKAIGKLIQYLRKVGTPLIGFENITREKKKGATNKGKSQKWVKKLDALISLPEKKQSVKLKWDKLNTSSRQARLVGDVLDQFSIILDEIQDLKNLDVADIRTFVKQGRKLHCFNGIGTGEDQVNTALENVFYHPLSQGVSKPKGIIIYIRTGYTFTPKDIGVVQTKIFNRIPKCKDVTFSIRASAKAHRIRIVVLVIEGNRNR